MGLLLRDRVRRARYRTSAATVARWFSESKGREAQLEHKAAKYRHGAHQPGRILALAEELERQAHKAPKDE
jgi:hypothetical protein